MSELKFDTKNYRIHGEKNLRLIGKSLSECGAGRSILIDKEDCIIAGNGVYQKAKEMSLPVRVIESDGTELIAIKRTDLTNKDDRRKALALADNYTSDTSVFDVDMILEDFSTEDLDAWEFSVSDVSIGDFPVVNTKRNQERAGSVEEHFIIPPFSILDTRSGRWQERKRAWLSLGIKSESGREEDLAFSHSAQPPRIYEIRNKLREATGIDPSWDDITDYCNKNNIKMADGTSIFDPVLCELIYRWFNTEKGIILDPFSGGSVRGIVAAHLGMTYYGVDLRREQIEANIANANDVLKGKRMPYWECADSRDIDKLFFNEKYDLLFSCPPYADLEVYSDDPRDLSNMKYEDFLEIYREIIRKSCFMLSDNRFAVFVVSEVRDKKGVYRNFVHDTIDAFRRAGLVYYNEIILVNQTGGLAMRISNQFNKSRKIGRHHQNVLVFYKGSVSAIKENYPALDFSDDVLFQE
jgi:DNA modification methylase